MSRLRISRQAMRHWAAGEILHMERGSGYAVPELECQAAEEALSRGETIELLSADGITVVSEMRLVDGAYAEVAR